MEKPGVIAGGSSQLEVGWREQKVQTRVGQVPAQPCFQICCSPPLQLMTFLKSGQQMPKSIRNGVLCA